MPGTEQGTFHPTQMPTTTLQHSFLNTVSEKKNLCCPKEIR